MLKERTIRAATWTLGGYVIGQVIRLGSNLIMTRLLVPEMFGIMALANVIMTGLALFSDLGLGQSVVQSQRGNDPTYLNTVWTVQILRGALIWLAASGIGAALYFLGTHHWLPVDSAYTNPVFPAVIAISSFGALISGFLSTRFASASRGLALGRITLLEILSQVIALAFMVGFAYWKRSIWALVVGGLVGSVLRTVLSHAILPGAKNALHWDQNAFREIYGFGKWIFVSSIVGFLATGGDRLQLGALTDPAKLGMYSIALFMVGTIQEVLLKLGASVAFPVLSEVARERPEALLRTYYKLRLPIDTVALMAAGFLFCAGHLLIRLLYDDRYQAAGHIVEILSICLFEVRFCIAGQCFVALGMPKLAIPGQVLRLSILFGCMPLAYKWYGFDGALWVICGSALSGLLFILYFMVRLRLFDLRRELTVLPLFGIGYVLGLIVDRLVFRFYPTGA